MKNKTPNIEVTRIWSERSVMDVCIANNLYTRGNCAEYTRMLQGIPTEPTPEAIFTIALDIYNHSEGNAITNIMFLLEKYAVETLFDVEGYDM